MARFSMVVAEPKHQVFRDKICYCLKDNEDKDSPINEWMGTEEKCKEMIRWLNDNVGIDSEFGFWDSNREEKIKYLERIFGCGVKFETATINDTFLIKFEKPICDLRSELSSALKIYYKSISVYNTKHWNARHSRGDDLAIINRRMM